MLFGIYANESSPCSLRINGILQGRGSFWVLNVLRTAWQYIPAHPDKGGIREVRTAVFLPAHLRGQEASEIPPMERHEQTYAYKRA